MVPPIEPVSNPMALATQAAHYLRVVGRGRREGQIMRCPFCGHAESQVKDSRPSEDGAAIRRRRHCTNPACGGRFTTFERVQLRELTILKPSARRSPFDREKLVRSISVAIRKRPVDPERVERLVNTIV